MIKTALSLLAVAALLGCDSSTTPAVGPQLWSDHKALDVSAEACADRALAALNSLGFTGAVRKDNFAYGNSGQNRAAVKCVALDGGSFVYFAVAGPEKAAVEKLRNQIAWKF